MKEIMCIAAHKNLKGEITEYCVTYRRTKAQREADENCPERCVTKPTEAMKRFMSQSPCVMDSKYSTMYFDR